MKITHKIVCLLAASVQIATAATNTVTAAASVNAALDPINVNVGGVSIKMPVPSAEFVEVGSDNRDFMRLFVPTQNRLVCGYVVTNDLIHVIKRDDSIQLNRYILVEVPQRGESMDCSAANFDEVVSGAKEAFGDKSGAGVSTAFAEVNDEISRRLKSLDVEGSISVGKPVQLGSLFSMKDAYSFAMITPVTANQQVIKVGMGGILMRVNNRLLFVYVYAIYQGEETIRYLGQITEKWAKQILAANPGT